MKPVLSCQLATGLRIFIRVVLAVIIPITLPTQWYAVTRVTLEAAGLTGMVAHWGQAEKGREKLVKQVLHRQSERAALLTCDMCVTLNKLCLSLNKGWMNEVLKGASLKRRLHVIFMKGAGVCGPVQLASSDQSLQSLSPSQCHASRMQTPRAHVNSPGPHWWVSEELKWMYSKTCVGLCYFMYSVDSWSVFHFK